LITLSFSFVLALGFGEFADRQARPRQARFGGGGAALLVRAGVIAWIWLLAFGLTGRPLFAATATGVSIAIAVAISNAKLRYLQEPLLFSDIPLLAHIPAHLDLFYVPRRWRAAAFGAVALLVAAIVAWLAVEPRGSADVQITALLLVAAGTAAVLRRDTLLAPAARLVGEAEPRTDVARLGLLATMLAYYASWRLEQVPAPVRTAPAPPAQPAAFDIIVIVQAESFVDLRRLGHADVRLPAFDRLRQRARCSGQLEVPGTGANTLRPESAVLTGRGFSEQGFDRFHPYLRPARFAANALPRLLAAAGWDTVFVHPFDRRFFRRHRAMPALGFARFIDDRAFAGAKRYGPFVSDEAVADLLLDTIERRKPGDPPLFAYVVTMEAHDPYGAGRLPDEDDPVRQYVRHLENADRMLGRIADRLDAGADRALLVAFGDHVPFLPEFADPFPDTRTDFVVAEFGRQARREQVGLIAATRPESLHALILRLLSDG
jgi:hypothetical protein